MVLSDINSYSSWIPPSPPSLSALLPRVRMEVPPPPVAQLNDEQGVAEVERALAARRNQRFSLVPVKKGKGKRRDEDDNSSEYINEMNQPQEPTVPVRVEGPVLSLADNSSEVKHALYRFMYLFENQRGCVTSTSELALSLHWQQEDMAWISVLRPSIKERISLRRPSTLHPN